MGSHGLTPQTSPLRVEDVVKELSDRLTGISVSNIEDEPVFAIDVDRKKETNTIEIVMSDDSKFVIEIKPKQA